MGLHVEKYHVVLWSTQSTTQKQAQHKLKIQFFWTDFPINQSIYFRGIQKTKAFNSSSMPTANSLEEQAQTVGTGA